ncbi:TIGR02594 family protein [Microbaculum marinum]|uniref:TIGR02594 family protein n=1 Tax=Microbaculum marinum TaxID=1764581 RepID=A0AAW9S0G0_9HYPH
MVKLMLGRIGVFVPALAAIAIAVLASGVPASARVIDGDPSVVSPSGVEPQGAAAESSASTASAGVSSFGGGGGKQTLSIASRYLGGNPTGRSSQWCADFMNLVERKAGRDGSGSRLARSYLGYGQKVSKPQPGDIVVLSRSGGGHVGYFMGWKDGQIELLSGNHSRKVGVGTYPTSRVLGYRRP